MFLNNFINKKILITGHTGFKGSWLSIILNNLGAKVIGIAKYKLDKPSLYSLAKISKIMKNEYFCDVSNCSKIKEIILNEKPNYIFHLAAQPIVSVAYEKPILTWNSNLMGSLSILEALRKLSNECITVMITSDKCYQNNEWLWGYKETDILGGEDPYSASKAATEIMIQSHIKSFFHSKSNKYIATARAGNVIGGGDWAKNRIIPDLIRGIMKKETVFVRNPSSTRPWQHVLEPLFGYLKLAAYLKQDQNIHGESFNFGPQMDNKHSVLDLIENLKMHFYKGDLKLKIKKNIKFQESGLLKLNCEKANEYLNWSPQLNFYETVEMTAKWYLNYLNKKNIFKFTNDQIQNYINRLK